MDTRFFDNNKQAFDPRYGFLPPELPLTKLPESSPLNIRINQIAHNLPKLIAVKKLREVVDQLNLEFPNEKVSFNIRNKQEQNVAFLFLTMIIQAYLWGDKKNPVCSVPKIFGNTLDSLCSLQKRFPTLTYADYALNNFTLKDPQGDITLNNTKPIITFTGSLDEEWFIKIHLAIEFACKEAIRAAYLMCTRVDLNEAALCNSLNIITTSMKKAVTILKQMNKFCGPDYFYQKIRPFFIGWEQIKNQDNMGVNLDGFTLLGDNLLFCYRGASGAQSTFLPALDAALGIQHNQNTTSAVLREFQFYMPQAHRHLIGMFKQNNIKQKIASSDNRTLQAAWEGAVDAVAAFRGMHIGYLKEYIMKPSGQPSQEFLGTGGTTPEYLMDRFKSTRTSKL